MESAYDLYMGEKRKKWDIFQDPTQNSDTKAKSTLFTPTGSPESKPSTPGSNFGSIFSNAMGYGGSIGAFLGGIGTIYDAHNRKKYQERIFNLEKDRVERAKNREAQANTILGNVWSK